MQPGIDCWLILAVSIVIVKQCDAVSSFHRNYTISLSSLSPETATYVRYKLCLTSQPHYVTANVSAKDPSLPNTFTATVVEILKPGVILKIKRNDIEAGWTEIEMIVNLYIVLDTGNCDALYAIGQRNSGSYQFNVSGVDVNLYCDMTTPNGPWTVFQRRFDGSVDFYQPWKYYEDGFGNVNTEFWMGLKYLHLLTESGNYLLRLDMTLCNGTSVFREYSNFRVGNASTNYTLTVDNNEHYTALRAHQGMQFSTFDRDNDNHDINNCAKKFQGGWWYNSCMNANLNGLYGPCETYRTYLHFKTLNTYSDGTLTKVEMKFKPN
ncbi:microfibril-associated glycoprotein 4-like isoform X1 [Ciona intestinalis]